MKRFSIKNGKLINIGGKKMNVQYESLSNEVKFIRKGSKERGLFFGVMGLLFQIMFLWGYWSFLDETGPWAIFWLTIIHSEMFPFTFILFVFGAGCILLAIREFGWQESLIIKTNLFQEIPGIRKDIRLFRWIRTTDILKNQIVTLRLHSILLDQFGVNKSYRIEVDYQEKVTSPIETMILFKDHEDTIQSSLGLVEKIHDILSLSKEIEKTESITFQLEGKKREKENNSKLT